MCHQSLRGKLREVQCEPEVPSRDGLWFSGVFRSLHVPRRCAIVSPLGTQPDPLLGSALRARRRRLTATPCCLSLSSADDEGALQRMLAREGEKSSARTTPVWDILSHVGCISFLLLQDRLPHTQISPWVRNPGIAGEAGSHAPDLTMLYPKCPPSCFLIRCLSGKRSASKSPQSSLAGDHRAHGCLLLRGQPETISLFRQGQALLSRAFPD